MDAKMRSGGDLKSAVGARLRLARKASSLTWEQVAKRCSVSRQTIGYWERGRKFPSAEHLETLAEIYGVALDWLFGRFEEGDWRIVDPELFIFVQREWDQLSEEEQSYVKGAIGMARNARLIRERQGHYNARPDDAEI